MRQQNLKLPPSKEVAARGCETVDAAPNQGNVTAAQPVVDAGVSGVGHWQGDGNNIKFVKE